MPDNAQNTGHKLRVLQMCAVDFTVQQFMLPLCAALVDAGYDVTISCSRGQYFDGIKRAGFDIRENPVARSANLFSHVRSLWRTWRWLRREKFDIVHVHTPVAALIGRIAAKLAGVPLKIYTAHGFYFHDEMPRWKQRCHVLLEKLGAACGDFILTVSAEDEQAALKLGIGKPGRIETVYNGVDTRRFDPTRFSESERNELRSKLGIPPEAPVIGFVGRLVREKGIFELFEAMGRVLKRFPDARLLVVGGKLESDRDQQSSLVAGAAATGDLRGKIVFAGLVEDSAPYLSIMDIFCLPSWREGMPVSLLEGMAMGCGCVATNIRGCREEIVDGESGLLVRTRDSASLAEAFERLLGDSALSKRLGNAARQRVLDRFNLNDVVRHQLEIYARLSAKT